MKIESFNWVIDANNDGVVSLQEIWATAKWLYELPGNLLVEGLGHVPEVAALFHIHASAATGYSSLDGWFSTTFALLFWLFALCLLSNLHTKAITPPNAENRQNLGNTLMEHLK